MDADGRNQRQLTNSAPGTADDPTWSPDGKHIAFEAAASSIRYGVGVTGEVGMDLASLVPCLWWVVPHHDAAQWARAAAPAPRMAPTSVTTASNKLFNERCNMNEKDEHKNDGEGEG